MSPYSDKGKAKEEARIRKQRQRAKVSHPSDVTPVMSHPETSENVTPVKKPSTVPTYFKGGIEMVGAEGILPERPRYHICTDGQVMDRASPPEGDLTRLSSKRLGDLRAWGNAPVFVPLRPGASRKVLREMLSTKPLGG